MCIITSYVMVLNLKFGVTHKAVVYQSGIAGVLETRYKWHSGSRTMALTMALSGTQVSPPQWHSVALRGGLSGTQWHSVALRPPDIMELSGTQVSPPPSA